MVQCQSSSAGRSTLVAMTPLAYGVRLTLETDLGGPDPNMCMTGITLQKDFQTSHIQYIYQGVHMLNYMQSISESLSAGYSMAFVPQHNRSIFSFGAKYNPNPQTTIIGAYNPTHP